MKNRVIKTRAVFSTILILAAVSIFIITCKNPASPGGPPGTPNGETRLVISMHDSRLASTARAANKEDTRNIQALNLAVREMNISGPDGGWLTIMSEPRSIDIIAASRGDPVVLSDVSVEPGVYKELRLVLSDGSTIKVDGEEFPLKVPSGEQSGLKLKGPFEIPKGKLFTLVIDLDTAKSVNWNQGQGWRLQPVLSVSNGATVLGVFRGNLTVSGGMGACETLLQLYADGTARLRIADYPNYTLSGNYAYNSITKNIVLSDFSLSAPGLKRRALKEVMKSIPEKITLPVKQWSLDSIIAVDINGLACNLYRVDEFDFSEGVSFTEFTINIDYPDASKTGKDVLTEIRFVDTGMPPLIRVNEFDGSRVTETVQVLNSYIQGSSTRILVTSYLFENPSFMNTDMGVYAGRHAVMMVESSFSETTENPWGKPYVFNIIRDMEGQAFNVSFPRRLNIQMHHDNFTNNKPAITWRPYPGATNGYYVNVLVKDKDGAAFDEGDGFFTVAYNAYTREPKVQVSSNRLTFTNTSTFMHEIPPSIVSGDFIIIEVYVLDGSGLLDTQAYKGAYLMDAKIIRR